MAKKMEAYGSEILGNAQRVWQCGHDAARLDGRSSFNSM